MQSVPDSVPVDPRYANGIGKGWFPIVERLHEEMAKIDPDYTVQQVKEKFGGLRYYYEPSGDYGTPVADALYALVRAAEDLCSRTCETCGSPGSCCSVDGWFVTLCDRCRDKESSIGGNVSDATEDC